MTEPHDDLAALLAPVDAPATGAALRDTILRRTQRRLLRRRWARRVVRATGAATVFATGVGVGVWRAPVPAGPSDPIVRPEVVVEVVTVPVPVLVPVAGGSAEQPPTPDATAGRLELAAEQADDAATAATLYRQAGDRYLTHEQDYTNAARCYRLFLARSGPSALSPAATDSWLLTSLKNAAFQEKIDAKTTNG